jgi:flavin reductase (DIM6/NTAB) family NADH-FMN oxidoreductase RutF
MQKTKRNLPLSWVYRLLEPGPVVLVTTAHKDRANVMTMSWHTMMEFEPPLVGCVISGRNYSFDALLKTRECVINIPTADLAQKVVKVGNSSGRRLDKFKAFGLTPLPASNVAPPLVAECYASLECRVADVRLVNKYNFFVLEVVKAWIDAGRKEPRTLHHEGRGVFRISGRTIRLPSGKK